MQTQQHVRKDRVVKHSILSISLMLVIIIVLGFLRRVSITSRSTIMSTTGICDSQSARVPAHGEAPAFGDPHESTQERTFRQVVLRGVIRGDFRKLRMHARAVIALRVIFKD